MLDKLGLDGIVGVVLVLGGIGLVATESLVIAAGIAFVLAGLGVVVRALVTGMLAAFGMGGMGGMP